ncbi:MAG: glycerol kinase GlpK [Clostridiales bacterium]|nr:glycerol kinase GlpK [Clostridiales bacterium]
MKYIIALDQGTTSSRALLFDEDQNIVCAAQREFAQIYPQPGWVEHDPMEIYASQYAVFMEALTKSGIAVRDVAGIGITNQRETTILWDRRTGAPVYNAIVWQCRRTHALCEELKARGLAPYIKQATGLIVDAYFSATKIAWILDNVPGARERAEAGELCFGTVDTWLVWKLSGGRAHVTDVTNASRTMLFNIHSLQWDEALLSALHIPLAILPEVKSSSEIYATVNVQGHHIPLAGIAGDQQAALFGQRCFGVGEAKNTYGTGCFLLMNTGRVAASSQNGLLTTIAIGLNGKVQYALEGSVFVGGAVVQWLRDELGLVRNAAETEIFANAVPDSAGVYIVPAFSGLGAPYWDMYTRGSMQGITRGTNRNHIVRAALEAIAYQSKDVLDAMQADTGISLSSLHVDGGASANNFLMQFQANILNKTVLRPATTEATALGAAYLAGLAVGVWPDISALSNRPRSEQRFEPNMDADRREALLQGWKKAVARSLGWDIAP